MNEKMIRKTGLRMRETPEILENAYSGIDGTIVTFADKILVAGFYWNGPGQNNYFGAVYETIYDEPIDAETDLELIAVSDGFFKDNGHAIEWAIKSITI